MNSRDTIGRVRTARERGDAADAVSCLALNYPVSSVVLLTGPVPNERWEDDQ